MVENIFVQMGLFLGLAVVSVGIALLIFVVGLKLDLHIIRTLGPVALASGLGQVIPPWGIGYLIALALGFSLR